MSRAYQIRVAESLTHHIDVEDGIQAKLELIGILSPDRTAQILAEHLAERGYTIEEGIAKREIEPGIEVEIDTRDGTVTVRARAEQHVELSTERTERAYEEVAAAAEKRLREKARKDLEQQAKERDEAVRQNLSDRLDRVLADIKPELDAVTDAVTRTALRERAGQLGEIVEVSENEAGEMTIRVRV